MHRHGYKGRKFHRERDQRVALLKNLAESLIKHGSIETSLAKAKELSKYVEKLITKAKKGDLHSRRQIISSLHTVANANKLVDEIAPKLKDRNSGHLRIERTHARRGDNTQLAQISFVNDLKAAATRKSSTAEQSSAASAGRNKSPATSNGTKTRTNKAKKPSREKAAGVKR